MRLVELILLALVSYSWAQANSWFYINNYDAAGCTGNILVFGYRADGTCCPNPPGYFKATCTGGTPNFQTCTDNACTQCTDGTPPTSCTAGEYIIAHLPVLKRIPFSCRRNLPKSDMFGWHLSRRK